MTQEMHHNSDETCMILLFCKLTYSPPQIAVNSTPRGAKKVPAEVLLSCCFSKLRAGLCISRPERQHILFVGGWSGGGGWIVWVLGPDLYSR